MKKSYVILMTAAIEICLQDIDGYEARKYEKIKNVKVGMLDKKSHVFICSQSKDTWYSKIVWCWNIWRLVQRERGEN